jgi:glycosyltransferase involved in cell wall biosynthesis
VESTIRRIINHTLFNKKLFWHNDCSDEDLNNLYESSQITLVTSQGEGFGLPLIEALSQGSQVIARDIPVFREIGQEEVIFFDINASNLVDVWMNALHNTREAKSESISQNYGYEDYAQVLRSIIEQRLQ